jgi:hypothetical protein
MSYPQTVQRCHEMIARLEKKIESLEDKLSELECREDGPTRYPKDPNRVKYGLSEREAELFALLKFERVTSCAWIEDQMGGKTGKYIATLIAILRSKLRKHDIDVVNYHGVGYRLERVHKTDCPPSR